MILNTITSMRNTLLLAAAALVIALPVRAQTTINAGLTTSIGTLTRGSGGFQTIGQSFTVPTLAPRLSSFGLDLTNAFAGGALRFDAYLYAFDTANRRLTGASLWSALNIAGSANDFAFDRRTFSIGSLALTPDAVYMFLLTTSNQGASVPADAGNLLGANDVNSYAGGSLWVSNNGSSITGLLGTGAFESVSGVSDLSFTAVFTSSSAVVPEPATVLLTAVGVALLAGVARRRRRV